VKKTIATLMMVLVSVSVFAKDKTTKDPNATPETAAFYNARIKNHDVFVGQWWEDVIAAVGKPCRGYSTETADSLSLQWVYVLSANGRLRSGISCPSPSFGPGPHFELPLVYVYIEDNRVSVIQK